MIVERGTPLSQISFLAETDTAARLGRMVMEDAKRPMRWVSLPGRILTLRRDAHRRNRFRRLAEAVHAGWDIDVPAGSAELPDEASIAKAEAWLAGGEDSPFHPPDPVLAAIAARRAELPILADALIQRLKNVEKPVKRHQTVTRQTNPKRVLYLTHVDFPERLSGYTRRSDEIVAALEARGVTVIRHSIAQAIDAAPRRFGGLISDQMSQVADELAAKLANNIDAVIAASDWRTGWIGRLASARLGLPFAYELRGFWELSHIAIHPYYEGSPAYEARSQLERALANHSEQIFTLSRAMADHLATQSPLALVPNAVNDSEPILERAAVDSSDLRLIYAGSLSPYEGLPTFVAGLSDAVRAGAKLALDIYGDGPDRGAIETAIRKAKMTAHIRLHGRVPADVAARALEQADAAILPRLDHPVCQIVEPLKPLEALRRGCPVLASPLRVLEDLPGVMMAEGFEAQDWTRLLTQVSSERDGLLKMGEMGRDYVLSERRWDHVIEPMIAWLERT